MASICSSLYSAYQFAAGVMQGKVNRRDELPSMSLAGHAVSNENPEVADHWFADHWVSNENPEVADHSVSNETAEFGREYQILERHQADYAKKFLDPLFGRQGANLIIAWYVADGKIMDREGWKFYFGVDIGPETDEIKEALEFDNFYKYYHGPNPVDLMEEGDPTLAVRQICETSLIPTIVPKKVGERNYNLRVLGELAAHPKNGHPATYVRASRVLKRHGTTRVSQSRLGILLEEVVACGQLWEDQVQYLIHLNAHTGYGCKSEPDLLTQNTILMAHRAVTGEYPFSDYRGMKGFWTYGRTVDTRKRRYVESKLVGRTYRDIYRLIYIHVSSGGFRAGSIGPLGDSAPAELDVRYDNFGNESVGVGVLRKF